MGDEFDGGCRYGAVRFVAHGQPDRWRGAVANVAANTARHLFPFSRHSSARIKGEITRFNSSPGRLRGFRARCGSTLTCEGERPPPETHFYVGAFDRLARFQPTRHIFPEERVPWFGFVRSFQIAAIGCL
jgi:hypothetical protein